MSYNDQEAVWVRRYLEIVNKVSALSAERMELEKRAKLGLNPDQIKRQRQLEAEIRLAQSSFDFFLQN